MVEPSPKWSDDDLSAIAARAQQGVVVRDRSYRFKTYHKCFVGKELAMWIKQEELVETLEQATLLGQAMLAKGHFNHVTRDHGFKNEELFYRWSTDEPHGAKENDNDSWHTYNYLY